MLINAASAATPAPTHNPDGTCYILNSSGGPLLTKIDSPAPYQVFQRDENLTSSVPISATFSSGSDCVEARVVSEADPSVVITPWQSITTAYTPPLTPAQGSISIPSGGWYQVQVRAVWAGNATEVPGTVGNVGSGEVFITAGQSNAGFWGMPPQKTATGNVSYFDGANWLRCADPIDLGDEGMGGAPWCLFGDMVTSYQHVPVAIAPVAYAGTPIGAWLPNATPTNRIELYDRLAARLKYFGVDGVRAILWHQGETDAIAGTSAANYGTALQAIIDNSRRSAGYDVPWYIGHPYMRTTDAVGGGDQVAQAQNAVVNSKDIFQGALTAPFRSNWYRHDLYHFNQAGLQQQAEEWFAAVLAPTQVYARGWPMRSTCSVCSSLMGIPHVPRSAPCNGLIGLEMRCTHIPQI